MFSEYTTVGEERPDADSTTAQREVSSNETAKNRNVESRVEAETTTVIETNEQNKQNKDASATSWVEVVQ